MDCAADDLVAYRNAYTSRIAFSLYHTTVVRLGPLNHITDGFPYSAALREGPLHHELHKGVYLIHRLRKNTYHNGSNGRVSNTNDICFTVIAHDRLDPLKIVKRLETISATHPDAHSCGSIVENRDWMELAAKPIGSKFGGEQSETSDQKLVRRRLAKTAHTSRLYGPTMKQKPGVCTMSSEQMNISDITTFYILVRPKGLDKTMRMVLANPEMGEFAGYTMRSTSPAVVGISLFDDIRDITIYVLYTHTAICGRRLNTKRAFAIVISPTLRPIQSKGVVRFGPELDCAEFLLFTGLTIKTILPVRKKRNIMVVAAQEKTKKKRQKRTNGPSLDLKMPKELQTTGVWDISADVTNDPISPDEYDEILKLISPFTEDNSIMDHFPEDLMEFIDCHISEDVRNMNSLDIESWLSDRVSFNT